MKVDAMAKEPIKTKTTKNTKTISREGLTRVLPWCLFAVFLVFISVTASNIVLFGDDYYYTTFTSGGFENFVSLNVSHWNEVNGRALVHIIDELLLWKGTIWLWRIFIVLCSGTAVFFAAAIASGAYVNGFKTHAFRLSLLGSVCLFSTLNIRMLNQTVYWATGSANYFFPCSIFFVYAFFSLKLYEKKERAAFAWFLLPLLAFFCGASIEQIGFGTVVFSLYIALSSIIKKKKPHMLHYINLLLSAAGCFLLFTAPGNTVRKTYYPDFYSMDLFSRIKQNIPLSGYYLFGIKGVTALVMLFSAFLFVYSLGKVFKRSNGFLYRLCGTVVSASAALLFARCVYNALNGYREEDLSSPFFLVPLALCVIAEIIRSLFAYFKRGSHAIIFWVLATGLQAAMLISPEMGPRTVLCSALLVFVPLLEFFLSAKKPFGKFFVFAVFAAALALCGQVGYVVALVMLAVFVFTAVFLKLRVKGFKAPLPGAFALALCALLALLQLDTILAGYAENKPVHDLNRSLVASYGGNGPLLQYYPVNELYRYTMAYDNAYHNSWYKISNGIAQDTELVWEEYIKDAPPAAPDGKD